MKISENDSKSKFKEKYLILYYKDHSWKIRCIRAESPTKAEEWFRYGPYPTKDVEYFEVYVFTGVTDYV